MFVLRVSLTKSTVVFGTAVYTVIHFLELCHLIYLKNHENPVVVFEAALTGHSSFFGVVDNLLTVFPLLQKSCQFRCMSFIFTGLTFFLLGNHSQVFSVHTGFISPSLIAALTWNRAAAMWLQVELVPAMQVQWALKIFPILPYVKPQFVRRISQSFRRSAVCS